MWVGVHRTSRQEHMLALIVLLNPSVHRWYRWLGRRKHTVLSRVS